MADRTVVITGAGRTIGQACAQRFAQDGDNLILAGKSEEKLTLVADGLREGGADVSIVCAETFNKLHVHNIIAEALETFGRVDVLAHTRMTPSSSDFFELGEEDFDQAVAENLRSAFLVNQAFAKHLVKQHEDPTTNDGGGVIINLVADEASAARADQAAFAAAEAGVESMTRVVANVLAPIGGRANCVSVGAVKPWLKTDAARDIARRETPLSRAADPSEVAETIFFLASPGAAFITGQTVTVDGGRRVYSPTEEEGAG
ncbi:MAG: SDR family oxidoreductase [Pseudomonadota bacterium]